MLDFRLSVIRGALVFNLIGYAFCALFLVAYPLGAISFYDKPSPGAFAGAALIVGAYFSVVGGSLAILISVGVSRLWMVAATSLLSGYFVATLSTQHAARPPL